MLTAPVRNPEAGEIVYISGVISASYWLCCSDSLGVRKCGTCCCYSFGRLNNSCRSESRFCWCSGSSSLSATGSVAVAGLTIAAVGAAVAGRMAAEKGIRKDAPTSADKLGEDFYRVLLQEEPFKSIKLYCWAPFLGWLDSSMLTVLLLLSKYRLSNGPMIETGKPYIYNFVTQTAVVQVLEQMKRKGLAADRYGFHNTIGYTIAS